MKYGQLTGKLGFLIDALDFPKLHFIKCYNILNKCLNIDTLSINLYVRLCSV